MYSVLKSILFSILIVTSLSACRSGHKNQVSELKSDIDSGILAILPYDSVHHRMFLNCMPAELSNAELNKIDSLIREFLVNYNKVSENEFDEMNGKHPEYALQRHHFVIELNRYKCQYIPVINASGEKEVWVNCFCETHGHDWHTYVIHVNDGGNCYFNLKINLRKDSIYHFMVNGDA